MAGSSRRGRLFGWFAENPATALAQAGPLLVHAGSNTLHTRNFRRTKSKNVAGAKPALIVLRKCVTRCRQRRQTKSQHRCDPWITNCEQINSHISHMVSPGLTDVAVATRRLAVLESSHHRIDASIDASRFSITRAPLFCIGADSAMAVPWFETGDARLSGPRAAIREADVGVSRQFPPPALIAIVGERMILRARLVGREHGSR